MRPLPATHRYAVPLAAGLLALAAFAAPAGATPVVYEMRGTLVVGRFQTDVLDLEGATLTLEATADSSAAPREIIQQSQGFLRALYTPLSLTATFSGRPGGAEDVTFAYEADLATWNLFPPNDVGADSLLLDVGLAEFEGVPVRMPSFRFLFPDREVFPGDGAAPLPVSGLGDGSAVGGGLQRVGGGGFFYNLTDETFTVVPEPATLPALVGGLALLALAARRR